MNAKILDISTTGVVVIQFTKSLESIPDISYYFNNKAIKFELHQNNIRKKYIVVSHWETKSQNKDLIEF